MAFFLAPLALAASTVLALPEGSAGDPGPSDPAAPAGSSVDVSVTGVRVVPSPARFWEPPESTRKKKKPRPRATQIRRAEAQAKAESTASLEEEVFGDDGDTRDRGPAGSVRRTPPDDDDDDDERPSALTVIAPHLVSFGLGLSMVGRSFGFNTQLQSENSFPRAGMAAALEAFPLLRLGGVISHFGVGASFEREIGSAAVEQTDGGSLGYPVSEGRWSVDLRYAFLFGQRFVLMPLVGFGHSGFDVQRRTETTVPSMCTAMTTQVCLPDVAVSHMTVGASGRFAMTPQWGLSVGLAVLPAFGVSRARGGLGVEGAPSALGYAAEVAVAWQLLDWLSLRAALPVTRYGYSWSGPMAPYSSASETYYSLVVGAAVFTN